MRRHLTRTAQGIALGLAAFQTGRLAVLYFSLAMLCFSTEHCIPCHTMLKPALQRLTSELGNRFQVSEVNAELQTEATHY
jgi:thiol-disulfide isomerase/thioredoxin